MTEFVTLGPLKASHHVLLAHGAGAPSSSPFMDRVAQLIADYDISVHRFDFGYMAARASEGTRRPPSKAPVLTAEYRAAVETLRASIGKTPKLFIGGKSMGGRMASLIADDLYSSGAIRGLVCIGYPFHPPGKPLSLRTAHLEDLKCPALIVQGERDPFGTREDVAGYGLSKTIQFSWVSDGDHDLKPRKATGMTQAAALSAAVERIADFIKRLS